MRVVGVLDLAGGRAVHAVAGHRERYAPVTAVAGASIRPGDALAVARSLSRFARTHRVVRRRSRRDWLARCAPTSPVRPACRGIARHACRRARGPWSGALARRRRQVGSGSAPRAARSAPRTSSSGSKRCRHMKRSWTSAGVVGAGSRRVQPRSAGRRTDRRARISARRRRGRRRGARGGLRRGVVIVIDLARVGTRRRA